MLRYSLLLLSFCCCAATAQYGSLSAEIETNIRGNITLGNIESLVIGISDGGSRRYYRYGEPFGDDELSLDEHSQFFIASVTKTFTGILLADMVQRGEMTLNEPIRPHVPPAYQDFEFARRITPLQLATHRSGLPRDWTTATHSTLASRDVLYEKAAAASIPAPEDIRPMYSNMGFSLLGVLLSNRAQLPLDQLMNERIFQPLGMMETTLTSAPANYQSTDLAGAGGIRSTAYDLLTYAEAQIGLTETALSESIRLSHIGLAWQTSNPIVSDIELAHHGSIEGWRAQLAISKSRELAVIVLARVTRAGGPLWRLPFYDLTFFDEDYGLENDKFSRGALVKNFVRPVYPRHIEDQMLSGSVLVSLTVDASGNVTNATTLESSLPVEFDVAALEAANLLKFHPKLEDGVAVEDTAVQYLFEF